MIKWLRQNVDGHTPTAAIHPQTRLWIFVHGEYSIGLSREIAWLWDKAKIELGGNVKNRLLLP